MGAQEHESDDAGDCDDDDMPIIEDEYEARPVGCFTLAVSVVDATLDCFPSSLYE